MTAITIEQQLESVLGVVPLGRTPLHGGCVSEVYAIHLPPGHPYGVSQVVAKIGNPETSKLDREGWMLTYLADNTSLPVPKVFFTSKTLLLLESLPNEGQLSSKVQVHAADLIAALHQCQAPQFGLEKDTLIGGLHQPNPHCNRWLEFYRRHRIEHMAEKAYLEGYLPVTTRQRLETFCEKMDCWLSEPSAPTLVHGDLWGGNVLCSENRVTGLIDPAIYYGHPEMDLAFSTLFHTFSTPFFNRYQEILSIEPDFWELRRDLYNLYPLLVHVRLFGGGSYVHTIEAILRRIGC